MTYSQTDVDSLRDILLDEKKKVEGSLASIKLQDPYSNPDRLNDNAASDTEANEESSHERMEALQKELTQNLEEIEAALARIDAGTYGKCESCGKIISIERLRVKPTAVLCVDCANKKKDSAH